MTAAVIPAPTCFPPTTIVWSQDQANEIMQTINEWMEDNPIATREPARVTVLRIIYTAIRRQHDAKGERVVRYRTLRSASIDVIHEDIMSLFPTTWIEVAQTIFGMPCTKPTPA